MKESLSFSEWYASLLPAEEATTRALLQQLRCLRSADHAGTIAALGMVLLGAVITTMFAIEYQWPQSLILIVVPVMALAFILFMIVNHFTWVARITAREVRKIDETVQSTPGAQVLLENLIQHGVIGARFYTKAKMIPW